MLSRLFLPESDCRKPVWGCSTGMLAFLAYSLVVMAGWLSTQRIACCFFSEGAMDLEPHPPLQCVELS